ncbi:MAG: 23S rRNA (pseudouridine(1915)-N(3))-methyltransferase RlmH [Steroidobacteraceae bacterium]
MLAIGTRPPAWVREGWDDYARRLQGRMPVKLTELAPGKRGKGLSTERAIEDEGKRTLAALKPADHLVMLDEHGRERTSVELSRWLADRQQSRVGLVIAIGGPDGFGADVRARAQESWSLSRLTLPHALVRVVLIEQLYRAVTLLDGHPYHRE